MNTKDCTATIVSGYAAGMQCDLPCGHPGNHRRVLPDPEYRSVLYWGNVRTP